MDTEEMMHWENVVALERADYGEGQLVEEYTGQAVVLISNGKMEYSGIGLVEVLWKVVEGSGRDFKSPAHSIHPLSQILPWVPGRSCHRYRHP